MKISEVTNTNEVDVNSFMKKAGGKIGGYLKGLKNQGMASAGNRAAQNELFVAELSKEILSSFKAAMAQGGITNKNQYTAEDFAEFLLQAGIQSDLVKKAFAQAGVRPQKVEPEQPVESKMFVEDTPLPPAKMLDVVRSALQMQSRAGSLNKITIPSYAGNPTQTARSIFTNMDRAENDPRNQGDQTIDMIVKQIHSLSKEQRELLTLRLSNPSAVNVDKT